MTWHITHDLFMLCMHLSDALTSCGMNVNRPGRFNGGLPRFGLDVSVQVV